MHKRSRVTRILVVGEILVTALAALLGAGILIGGIILLVQSLRGDADNYMWAGIPVLVGLGLALLVPGIRGLRSWIGGAKGRRSPLAQEAFELPFPRLDKASVGARVAAGLCLRCGGSVPSGAKNCQWCGLDPAWAREHPDEPASRTNDWV